VQARDDAKAKEAVAQQALEEATTLSSRIEDLRKLIDQERKSLELAGKKSDLALRTERDLKQELERMLSEGALWTDLQDLRKRIAEANRQDEEARAAARDSAKRLDDIQSELGELHARQIAATQDAEKRRLEAEAAQKKVEQLENPFALKNLARWSIEHGPRLGGCVIGMAFLLWLARRLETQLIAMGVASSERGSTRERENRTRTLVAVFHNAASTAVIITGTVLVLNEVGVNVALIMGGAAVFGLAVAFGAQNLIRDYFYGFVILLENQYKLNDVVRIGTIAGQVERITLRMTVLRDLEGNVHFIPNGQILSVCNKTHGWSRAVFDIPVAYKEDVDQIMRLLVDVSKGVQRDPQFAPLILEDPTMLGVDSLGDSAVNIKFYIKTKPLQQWTVKREILRRIKKRFDESNVEIPFPHRMVYYRNLSEETSEAVASPSSRAAA
jgi:moderate conductance mechanosensitive channel